MLKRFLLTQAQVLVFQNPSIEKADERAFLIGGLLIAWLVGIGRYWDHPNVAWWQYAGLGSFAYVFVFAGLLWGIGRPLRLRGWGLTTVLMFVSFTALPGILHAVPVESLLDFEPASEVNGWLLIVVALWRLALLVWFLAAATKYDGLASWTVSLLVMFVVTTVLSALNLEGATYEQNRIVRTPEDRVGLTTDDYALRLVMTSTLVLWYGFLPLLICYLSMFAGRRSWAVDDDEWPSDEELARPHGSRPS